jgi:hypothetical protein
VIPKPTTRTTHGSLREGGIERRRHIAKEGIRSRGEEQRKRIGRDMKYHYKRERDELMASLLKTMSTRLSIRVLMLMVSICGKMVK